MDLTLFPEELLFMIMINLDHKSLNNLKSTCLLFNELCHDISFLKQKKLRIISQFDLENNQDNINYLFEMGRCFSNTLELNKPYGDYLLKQEETLDETIHFVMINGHKFCVDPNYPIYFKVRINGIEIKKEHSMMYSVTKYKNNKKKVRFWYKIPNCYWMKNDIISATYFHNEKLEYSFAEYSERHKCYVFKIKNFDPKYSREYTTIRVGEKYLELYERYIMNSN